MMHGFTDNAKNYAETLLPMLSAELGSSEQPPDAHVRFVFLQAPQRRISCYGEPRQRHAAWHEAEIARVRAAGVRVCVHTLAHNRLII